MITHENNNTYLFIFQDFSKFYVHKFPFHKGTPIQNAWAADAGF